MFDSTNPLVTSGCPTCNGSSGCDSSNPTGPDDPTLQTSLDAASNDFSSGINGVAFGTPTAVPGLGLPPYWWTVKPSPADLIAANLSGDFSAFGISMLAWANQAQGS